jgi:Glyoxalase/Bleomycin resistance protein/Dioxygenase superfamily
LAVKPEGLQRWTLRRQHREGGQDALPVDTLEEFDAAYQRLEDHRVAVTEIIERGYGKTFYFHDPNGIRLQIELKTKQDADSLEGDPDPVPYVRALLHRSAVGARSRTDR